MTIIANFAFVGEGGKDKTDDGVIDAPLPPVMAAAGTMVSVPLPEGVDGGKIVVCYTDENGMEKTVPWSAVIDGNLCFIAPVDGEYCFREGDAGFTDIKGHWAKDYIEFAYSRNLFKGVGSRLFAPNDKMTRAMFVTVLGRLHGTDPEAFEGSSFNDVPAGKWYSPYVQWAAENGIVLGSGGRFETDREITRQEMCVILKRYAEYAGLNLSENVEVPGIVDEDMISGWASEAVEFARRTGLMLGDNKNKFNPRSSATRAEVATVFRRLIEKVLEQMQ